MTRTFKKERKGKGLLYLIVIVAMALAMVIACKNKPTQTSDFSGVDLDMEVTNGASTNPKPSDNPVSVDADLDQYAGVYKSIYEYREGWNDSQRTFYYKMELKKDSANKWQLLWKKGDYANSGVSYGGGYEVIRTLNRDKANDNATRGKAFGDWETHYVTLESDANGVYLTLIPDRYSIVIRCKKE